VRPSRLTVQTCNVVLHGCNLFAAHQGVPSAAVNSGHRGSSMRVRSELTNVDRINISSGFVHARAERSRRLVFKTSR
jgi:hypothetical protein